MEITQTMSALASLQTGALHPLLGVDHLLALLGMGMLYKSAKRSENGSKFSHSSAPMQHASLMFVPLMLLAAIGGLNGLGLPEMETGITLSLIVLGAVLMQQTRIPNSLKIPAVSGFAIYHGLAHGLEMPITAQPMYYLIGMVLTSCLLLALGAQLSSLLSLKIRKPESKAGFVLALLGSCLMV